MLDTILFFSLFYNLRMQVLKKTINFYTLWKEKDNHPNKLKKKEKKLEKDYKKNIEVIKDGACKSSSR